MYTGFEATFAKLDKVVGKVERTSGDFWNIIEENVYEVDYEYIHVTNSHDGEKLDVYYLGVGRKQREFVRARA